MQNLRRYTSSPVLAPESQWGKLTTVLKKRKTSKTQTAAPHSVRTDAQNHNLVKPNLIATNSHLRKTSPKGLHPEKLLLAVMCDERKHFWELAYISIIKTKKETENWKTEEKQSGRQERGKYVDQTKYWRMDQI